MTKTLLTRLFFLLSCFASSFLYSQGASSSILDNSFDESIIETSVLINLSSIRQNGQSNSKTTTNRRLSSQYSAIGANDAQAIDSNVSLYQNTFNNLTDDSNTSFPTLDVSSPITKDNSFITSLTGVFDTMPAASLVDGVDYTINYLAENKDPLGLTDHSLILAIKSVYSAFISRKTPTRIYPKPSKTYRFEPYPTSFLLEPHCGIRMLPNGQSRLLGLWSGNFGI